MSVYIPCKCGNARDDGDLGSSRCVTCRRRCGEVSAPELAAAIARTDRQSGGEAPRVAWITEKAPQWLWASTPPAKDNPRRVVILTVDADA